MEDVHHLLSSAYIQPTHKEASEKLKELDSLISSLSNPIDSTVLKLTRKILLKFGNSLYGTLPKLYIKYLKLIDKSNSDLLITLCNDALIIKDSLTGTEICESINNYVREALVFLVQQGTLDPQQSQVVQQLLENKSTFDFEEQLVMVLEEIENNSSIGMHMLIDLFSTMSSTKDHFYYFSTQISPVVKALQNKKSIEVYNVALKFVDIFLSPTRFLVKIGENSIPYQLSSLKYYPLYEDVFYTSLSFLKVFLKSDRYINEQSVRLIYKLWNLYPSLRSHLFELIITNFKTIAVSNSIDPRRKAAEFLYVIMHDKTVDGDFKGKLESEGLESLFEDENYDSSELAPIDLKDLKISTAYPTCCEVKPGEKYSHFVEIEEENSILTWGFATEEYDISYTISRMDSVEEILYKGERVSCDESPVHGLQFVQSPGLYKFEWNNDFSWFRSKKLRFRICVLVPITDPGHVEEPLAINVLNPDEAGDLCYILPNYDYAEIGVSISSESISFYCKETDVFPLHPSDDIPSIISRYCDLVPNKVKKIGIVEKVPVQREYVLENGCFAVSRDVDAFALINHDSLKVHTLIAVVESEGLRSAVVIDGKLFNSGNIANLKNQEPAVAIATLMALFGPATVVVTGLDFEKIVARARLLVPVGIWNHSQIVLSDFKLEECASRLHYLLYRYKSSL